MIRLPTTVVEQQRNLRGIIAHLERRGQPYDDETLGIAMGLSTARIGELLSAPTAVNSLEETSETGEKLFEPACTATQAEDAEMAVGVGHHLRSAVENLDERRKLVVYGQSYGGAAVVKFTWRLARMQVPVYLTVQIDSVGTDDARIPPNVTFAANLYQENGWIIAGENPIRAVDPSRTRILGNWLFDYDSPPGSEITIDDLSFWKKLMRVAHAKMDRDPRVWELTESLIRAACEAEGL